MFKYILDRLREPSTIRGIVNFVTGIMASVGIAVKPEMTEQIIAAGLAVVGLLAMIVPDPKPPEEPKP